MLNFQRTRIINIQNWKCLRKARHMRKLTVIVTDTTSNQHPWRDFQQKATATKPLNVSQNSRLGQFKVSYVTL